ncbi:conserved Plasmodium protein, unknown function [Plasmodium knowlesi strain H]|uniref:BIR protein n=3 Tax=Plasmodium knowlesi TaxID=5850 RepID=A0A5K1VMV0_PLAKH|nr:uncharacterized protein PKNH_0316000 [Plasmodium knowlesi strain H]OTN68487.1 Uncharacterized protein PKNOH_S02308400 [Plasmodium knowlesi]CAA9986585.1 conserved protein, unknown function [Plasmodium knowlesi strain H]SBO24142.1 conserved Plasmodium protein, unknown function [Plasmodium knowlesi strain H]SBO29297.1 conserved Plasmodium protein, unknown function [Plasmodium knowlesi strain H]VVS76059.1 conserved protein, unknown function [Plasmodium knowlesi strain H]|eukprot:XP_002261126.1 [Plasmodium knowlesi strain H]
MIGRGTQLGGQRRGYFTAIDRKLREVPYLSRYIILDKFKKKPRYMDECPGTPRRAYGYNCFDRIRFKPTFNPYVKLNKDKKYRLDNWESRNSDRFDPLKCYVRGSRKAYDVPFAILPSKDELGNFHPPVLSGRYRADIEKQYYMHDLPWVWHKNFYTGTKHFCDNMVVGKKEWYRREQQKEKMKEAMGKINDLVLEYRQEFRDKKRYNFLERVVNTLGEDVAHKYIRKIKNVYL